MVTKCLNYQNGKKKYANPFFRFGLHVIVTLRIQTKTVLEWHKWIKNKKKNRENEYMYVYRIRINLFKTNEMKANGGSSFCWWYYSIALDINKLMWPIEFMWNLNKQKKKNAQNANVLFFLHFWFPFLHSVLSYAFLSAIVFSTKGIKVAHIVYTSTSHYAQYVHTHTYHSFLLLP